MTDPQEKERKPDDRKSLPFLDHLEELRWTLLKSFIAVVIMGLAAFYFREEIFSFILKPLGDTKLHVTEVTGSFYAYLKVSIVTGILVATPIVFYQIWSFVSPGSNCQLVCSRRLFKQLGHLLEEFFFVLELSIDGGKPDIGDFIHLAQPFHH